MTEFQLGWFCGLVDGEGCITLRKSCNTFVPFLSVTNTNTAIVEEAQRLLQTIGIFGYDSIVPETTTEKKVHRVVIQQRDDLRNILFRIKDGLIGKKQQALHVLEFIALRQAKPRFSPMGNREKELYNLVHELNRKGPKLCVPL